MLYLLKFYLNSLLTMSIDVSHLLRNNLFVKYLYDFMSRIYVTGVYIYILFKGFKINVY